MRHERAPSYRGPPLRVLQVSRHGSVKGGAETYVRALCEGLRAAGHTVALAYALDPDPERPEVRDGYAVPGIAEPGPLRDGAAARALADAVEAFRPDLVHVHLPDVPWVAPLCGQAAPTVLAVHDHRLHCPVGTKYWAAWHKACTVRPGPWCLAYNVAGHCGSLRANATLRPYRQWHAARDAARGGRIQVFSHAVAAETARAGLDPARIEVTPYPVPPLATPVPVADDDPRPVVLASGRLNKEKGFGQAIEALGHLRVRAHLVIAGRGHERAALERRARAAAGGHRVTFTGWLSPAQLAGWYERAAVVAVPSMWPEPFGIVGLEAMARARPVVAFDSGGVSEWLADGVNGSLVPPGDVRGLARALESLLRDEDLRARMGEAGRAMARSLFSLERHTDRVLAMYGAARSGA